MDFTTKVGTSRKSFYEDTLLPLSWFHLGSVSELRDMPYRSLCLMAACLKEERIVDLYKSL